MSENKLKKTTVFRIPEESFGDFKHDDYSEVASGALQTRERTAAYRLFFAHFEAKDPAWLATFAGLDLAIGVGERPQVQHAGFIMLVGIAGHCYAVTGGLGHLHLKSVVEVEPDFGLELAERILVAGEVKGLAQRDTGSKVFALDRHFGGLYNPEEDMANLKRILKKLRAVIDSKNPHHSDIGKSIVASDALSVTGDKSFSAIVEFVIQVDDLYRRGTRSLRVPRLKPLMGKDRALVEELERTLVAKFVTLPDGHRSFHLDVFEVPVDDVTEFRIRTRPEILEVTYQDLMLAIGGRLRELASHAERITALKGFRLRYWVGSIESEDVLFYRLLCGDVEYGGESYYLFSNRWYRADKDYIKLLNTELDQLRYLPAEDLQLLPWSQPDDGSDYGEGVYNDAHAATHVVLDRRTISVSEHRGPIEFCDLLLNCKIGTFLIHVKHGHGASLRELFSQGYVSAQLYASSVEFRSSVHQGVLSERQPPLSPADLATVASLENSARGSLTVVFAIFDDEPTSESNREGRVLEALGGTLTTFAKVDLLGRVATIRDLGYMIALTRIKPFPAPRSNSNTKSITARAVRKGAKRKKKR